MLKAEKSAAATSIPPGFSLVETGLVEHGDMIWDFVGQKWSIVASPKPFQKGQKRPGVNQQTEIGMNVQTFVSVARKQ